MAVFEWITEIKGVDICLALKGPLTSAGFQIDEVGKTDMQLSALCCPEVVSGYWSGVRVIAIWSDQRNMQVKIEVRSDEPTLRRGTHCEQRAKMLMKTLPPI